MADYAWGQPCYGRVTDNRLSAARLTPRHHRFARQAEPNPVSRVLRRMAPGVGGQALWHTQDHRHEQPLLVIPGNITLSRHYTRVFPLIHE